MNLFPRGIKAAIAFSCLLFSTLGGLAYAEPVEQDTVEAAMTLQLLGFTEWPDGGIREATTPRIIGIMDSEPVYAAFESLLADPRFEGRFLILRIDENTASEELFRCDALFFNKPDPTEIPRMVKKLADRPIVLIGSFEGFLEQGGLVNLTKKQRRLGFEIHMGNSKRRDIEYRAKLLRLATRIVQE